MSAPQSYSISVLSESGGEAARFTLHPPQRLHVGSGENADIRLAPGPRCDAMHARIDVDSESCRLQILAGRALARVNGQLTAQASLQDGDVVEIGSNRLAVHAATTIEASAPAALRRAAPTDAGSTDPKALEETIIGSADDGGACAEESPTISHPDYDLVRVIGRGGMGVVYEAVHKERGERFAIKVLRTPSSTAAERASARSKLALFLREAAVLSELRHPRIVRFHEMGFADDRMYIVMEYVDSVDLMQLLDLQPLDGRIRLAVGTACHVLEALHFAHGRGMVHRDVKPTNILVTHADGKLSAKLSDFGLAKSFETAGLSAMTAEGERRGTVGYMAPEQFVDSCHAKPPADIYSVGVTLYQLICGELPFSDTSLGALLNENNRPRPLTEVLPDTPSALSAILLQAMEQKPHNRFKSAEDLRQALLPFRSFGRNA